MSTGVGPFTFYESLSGSRPRSRPARPEGRRPVTTAAAAAKLSRAKEIDQRLSELTSLHRAEFQPLTPPIAEMPRVPSASQVVREVRRELLARVRWFDLPGRWRARRQARQEGARRHAADIAAAEAERAQRQVELDKSWHRFLAGETAAVLDVLNGAFADNAAPAAAVGLDGTEAQLAVLVPGEEVVPDQMPGITQAGNVSLRRTTKTQRAEVHREMVAGYVLATVKEAFAVAPSVAGAAVVAMRDEGPDVFGEDRVRPVLAVRLTRAVLDTVRWAESSAWDVVEQAGEDLRIQLDGRTRALEPLDLSAEPELSRLVGAVQWTGDPR